jgi:hypothetical protein
MPMSGKTMKILTDIEKGIMDEFDREFPSPDGQDFIGMERISSIKSFISSALAQQREFFKQNLEGVVGEESEVGHEPKVPCKGCISEGINQKREEIRNKIEELLK